MRTLNLKPTHKPVREYYSALQKAQQLSLLHEGNVAPLFANLLRSCANQFEWQLAEQYQIARKGRNPLRADGVLLNSFKLIQGVWEAKDSQDDLNKEIKKKLAEGYPKDNILFQAPERVVLYQNGVLVADENISQPEKLVEILKLFFEFQPPAYEQWETAVSEFKERIPQIAQGVLALIHTESNRNMVFIEAFGAFMELCRQSINPHIDKAEAEEMLIQHLLTERIFRKVFNNPDFAKRNAIAQEIEKVIEALTSRSFSREEFLKQLDRFYGAIEATAATIDDFSQKQAFLNTVYEQFFQGFSVKVADTHGIVYTPQPVVDFMVSSVDELLKHEFSKPHGLGDKDIHILDPFVGTGNFILRVMRQIPKSRLAYKYQHELHCNEVMLLPYYIASMNIEHDFLELTGEYKPFEGICLVDTFELVEGGQKSFPFLVPKNTERVLNQKKSPIFVILGNPPYNAHQIDENDNSKNRKHPILDQRIADTYIKDSKATLTSALYDPYVKAFRWAIDRMKSTKEGATGEGIIAFVTNNSFLDDYAFDGMRKHLAQDISTIYHINLKGNARTSGERRRQEAGNIFGNLIRVSIGITFLICKKQPQDETKIFIYSVDDYLKAVEKQELILKSGTYQNINFSQITPTKKHVWMTEGLNSEFETFMAMGSKEGKKSLNGGVIFKSYSNGVKSNNDAFVYNFNQKNLINIAQKMVNNYQEHLERWISRGKPKELDNILQINEKTLKWIRNTKRNLLRGTPIIFDKEKIRQAHYRPFCKQFYYFERIFNEDTYHFPKLFPSPQIELENLVISLHGLGMSKPFHALITNNICDVQLTPNGQNFPFYVYDKEGNNQKENITNWALKQFQENYQDEKISKWDIFYYIYALLHHPTYRENYSANLRLELPHIPLVNYFWEFATAGKKLAELHVNYEQQAEYPLQFLENQDLPLDWWVEKMRLSKDKTSLVYNNFLTLAGIPAEVFDYKLGNRSALEWVIEQYQVTTDGRSGITNDPNRPDDPQYIVRLVGQVITVSLETLRIISQLPPLEIIKSS